MTFRHEGRITRGSFRGLVAAALLMAAPAGAVTLTRGPYLQLESTHGVTVVWDTDAPAACSLDVRPEGGQPTVIAGSTGTVCAIRADGLVPGTRYAYAPQADGVALAGEEVFETDHPTLPFTFLVMGESGCGGCLPGLALRNAMYATPVDFVLHTGGMIGGGLGANYDPDFFTPYRTLLRRLVIWPAIDNHDVRADGGAAWRSTFYTPANNPARSENYYSFDFGNAHVVVLDTNASTSPGSAEHTFLDNDLRTSTATWKFVAFHDTIYSSGSHGSDLTVRANLVPLFDKYGVDMVFMGDDHDYERTKPLRNNVAVQPGAGTVYVTTGGGGDQLRPVGASSFTAYAESAFHFTRVTVDGGRLIEQMVREDGAIRDAITLVKGTAPPPRCGDDLVDQPGEQCDGLDHVACPGPCAADCTCAPVCGDDRLDQTTEACDGHDDAGCPGLCLTDCRCGDSSQVLRLAPVADTYIQAGAQATADHGASDHVDVDLAPADIAYLKFDLSAVTRPVVAAKLKLHCTNASSDGGTIYPVPNSSWAEGSGVGSASGPGLKWSDVDTNLDGKVDAHDASPFVPDYTRPIAWLGGVLVGQDVSVDVTAALQAGPGVYTLAIRNDTTAGATYASREDLNQVERPELEIELQAPTTTTSTTSTTTTSTSSTAPTTSTSSTTSSTSTVPTTSTSTSSTAPTTPTSSTTSSTSTVPTTSTSTSSTAPTTPTSSTTSSSSTVPTTSSSTTSTTATTSTTTTTVAQVGAVGTVEADVKVHEQNPDVSFGSNAVLDASGQATKREQTYFRVRVSGVGTRPVVSARLQLQVASAFNAGGDSGGRIHRISACGWSELTTTWRNRPVIDGAVLSTVGPVQPGQVVTFDVTSAITGDGVYCFALDSTSINGVKYNSRESSGQRPAVLLQVAP